MVLPGLRLPSLPMLPVSKDLLEASRQRVAATTALPRTKTSLKTAPHKDLPPMGLLEFTQTACE